MRRRLLVLPVASALLCMAIPAFAHVEVTPVEAARGTKATLTFSVPNEEDNAKTTTVEIYLPSTVDRGTVSATPPSGWQYVVTESPGSVRFTGGAIAGTDEVDFPITLTTPSSGTDELVFKTVQTYDNGDVVRWIEPTPPGGDEPEHPDAVVKLTGAATSTTKAGSATSGARTKHRDSKGGLAVIVALLAVVVAGLGISSQRRSRST